MTDMDLAGVLRTLEGAESAMMAAADGKLRPVLLADVYIPALQKIRATIARLAERTEQPVAWPRRLAKTDHVADEIAKFCDVRQAYREGWNECLDACAAHPSGLVTALRGLRRYDVSSTHAFPEVAGKWISHYELDRIIAAHEGEKP